MGVYDKPGERMFAFANFVGMALLAALFWVGVATKPDAIEWAGAVVCSLAAAKMFWDGLLRTAYRVEVREEGLRWRSPLLSGVVPYGDITAIEQRRPGQDVKVRHAGTPVVVSAGRGITELVAAIRARKKGLADPGVSAPGPSRWRPEANWWPG